MSLSDPSSQRLATTPYDTANIDQFNHSYTCKIPRSLSYLFSGVKRLLYPDTTCSQHEAVLYDHNYQNSILCCISLCVIFVHRV